MFFWTSNPPCRHFSPEDPHCRFDALGTHQGQCGPQTKLSNAKRGLATRACQSARALIVHSLRELGPAWATAADIRTAGHLVGGGGRPELYEGPLRGQEATVRGRCGMSASPLQADVADPSVDISNGAKCGHADLPPAQCPCRRRSDNQQRTVTPSSRSRRSHIGGVTPCRPTRHARPCSVPSGCLAATMKTFAPGLRSVLSPTS
jgi:hypothetical protein